MPAMMPQKLSPATSQLFREVQKNTLPLAHGKARNGEVLSRFISLIITHEPTSLTSGILEPSFCLIIQGEKEAHIGEEVLTYGPGRYLASIIDMPISARVTRASKTAPYVGLRFALSSEDVLSVAFEAKLRFQKGEPAQAAFVGHPTSDFMAAVLKASELLKTQNRHDYLLSLAHKEIIFHLLNGPDGARIYLNALRTGDSSGLQVALQWLKENFKENFTVEELAKRAHMSVSSLHHKFKAVTTMGPLQYQKRLRLQEARKLLLAGTYDVTETAYEVGYESASQFSREYKRLYGKSPLQDVKQIKTASLVALD